jgi:hypothetical protein
MSPELQNKESTMLRPLGVLAFVGVLALCAPAADEVEKVELKEYKSKVGDRVRVVDDDRSVTRTIIETDGKREEKVERSSKLTVYVSETLAVKDGENKAVKLKRVYEKAEEVKDGTASKLPLDGKTVTIEKKGDKYTFTYDGGKAVEGKALEELDKEFNKKDEDDIEDFIPKRPLKLGEKWTMDTDKLVKSLSKDKDPFEVDKKKVTATGTLADVYTFGGHKYGVYDLQLEFPLTALSGAAKVPLKPGSKMAMHIVGDGNVDGGEPDGTMTLRMTLRIFFEAPNGAVGNIKVDGVATRSTEKLPPPKRD